MTGDETQGNMGKTKMRDEVRFLLSAFLCCLCVSPQRYVLVELLSTFNLDQTFSFKILHHEQMFDPLATSCCLA